MTFRPALQTAAAPPLEAATTPPESIARPAVRVAGRRAGRGRRHIFWIGCLLAVVGLALSAWGQVQLARQAELTPGIWALIGGAALFGTGSAVSAWGIPIRWIGAWPGPRPRHGRRRLWVAGGLLIALILGVAAGILWQRGGFNNQTSNSAALIWIAGMAVAAITLTAAGWWGTSPPNPLLHRWRGGGGVGSSLPTLLPIGVFVVALALRLYQLEQVPFGIWFDEGETGLEGRRLLAGADYEPLSHNFGKDPASFFYLVSFSFRVFGDSLFAVRFVTALLGALGVVATALFAREVFGWRVGLVAGLLMAFSRWQLDFSRFGMINVTAPLMAAVTFWLLARAIRRESWVDLGWCGLLMGLGFHGYAGFRVIFGVLVAGFLFGAVIRRWHPRAIVGRAALWLALIMLGGLPVILYAVQFPNEYNKRLNETFLLANKNSTQERVDAVVNNTKAHLLMFHYRGDRNGRHNLPGLPMLDAVGGILFVLGLAWAMIGSFRLDWRYVILILWGVGALSGGILSLDFEAPQGARTIAVTGVLSILAALGLVLGIDRAAAGIGQIQRGIARGRRLSWRLGPPVAALIAGWAVISIGWTTADTYFEKQMPGRSTWLEFSPRETIIAKEAQRLSAEYPIALTTHTVVGHPTIRFAAPGLKELQPFDPVGDLPLRRAGSAVIFLDDRDRALWDEVARYYPESPSIQFFPPQEPGPVLIEHPISREQVEARRGLEGTYRSDGATVGRQDRAIEFDWRTSPPPVPFPFDVEWSGGLVIPQTGEHTFLIPDGFTLTVDGRDLPAAEWRQGARLRLARGNHRIRLAGPVPEPRDVWLQWRAPGSGNFAPIPGDLYYQGVPGGTGLLGRYYPGNNWQGQPAQERIDPTLALYFHLLPLARPYSAEWSGTLDVPAAGSYRIGVEQVSTATVWIDDRQVLNSETRNQLQETPVNLAAGPHSIRVRYRDVDGGSHIYLYWTPPGRPREAIPGRYLSPPAPDPLR